MACTYLIDGRIDLRKVCSEADWHHATCVDLLVAAGIAANDAAAFADFAINEHAIECDGKVDTYSSDELLTADQDDRLSLA